MIEFGRRKKTLMQLPLTAMIDVVFILIIFFMLTTNLMRAESIEVMLPGSSSAPKAAPETVSRIYLTGAGFKYEKVEMSREELSSALKAQFQSSPDQRILVMTGSTVSLQSLVDVMDLVYQAGGKNVYVKEWSGNAE